MKQNLLMGAVLLVVIVGGIMWAMRDDNKEQVSSPTPNATNSEMLRGNAEYTVITENVAYTSSATGYLARPEGQVSYPGVVMIHEWWGLNDNIKDMARQLAGEGYAVLAVDLYQGKVAKDATEARTLVSSINQPAATANLRAATKYLRDNGSSKIASLGWCFGGGQSLNLALSGEQLDGTVIYYGNLVTDKAKLASVKWPVLGVFGDQDQSIPIASVQAFDKALDEIGVQNDIHIYPGVGHAFANPSGTSYAPGPTADAWAKTLAFLKKNLANKSTSSL